MINTLDVLGSNRHREVFGLGFAGALHALLLLWNPILFRSTWRAVLDPSVRPGIEIFVGDPSISPAQTGGGPGPEQKMRKPLLPSVAPLPQTTRSFRMPATMLPVPHPAQRILPEQGLALDRSVRQIQTEDLRSTVDQQRGAPLVSRHFSGNSLPALPFPVDPAKSIEGSLIPITIDNRAPGRAIGQKAARWAERGTRYLGSPGLLVRTESVSTLLEEGPRGQAAPQQAAGRSGVTAVSGTLVDRSFGRGWGGENVGGRRSGKGAIPGPVEAPPQEIPERTPRTTPNLPALEGPLANRAVLHRVIPSYPPWAEEQGVMGSVRLYFSVTQDGHVRSNIRVTQASVYPDLDRLSIDALRKWLFAPNFASDEEGQWGIITFAFSLARG